jgi:hypothetical protein
LIRKKKNITKQNTSMQESFCRWYVKERLLQNEVDTDMVEIVHRKNVCGGQRDLAIM